MGERVVPGPKRVRSVGAIPATRTRRDRTTRSAPMPHFKCLPCKTRLYGGESQAEAIGHLCPVCGSLLKPVGDLGEIVGYGVIETRDSTWHSGASGAGQLIADRVGEVIAQRELQH